MKKKTRNRLIRIALMIVVIVALAEFQKFMKSRGGTCADGVCERPANYGLIVDPFPDETAPTHQAETLEGKTGNE